MSLGENQSSSSFADQVLEYHPEPANEWLKVGDLQKTRAAHATLSIGTQELPCSAAGGSFKRENMLNGNLQLAADTQKVL